MMLLKLDIGKSDRKIIREEIEDMRDEFESSYISLDFRFTNKKTKDYFCEGESILRLGISARDESNLSQFAELIIDRYSIN